MQIGFFTDGYLPAGHGFAVSLESFRRELEARGHKVWIFAPSSPGYRDAHVRVIRFPSLRITSKPPIRLALPIEPYFRDRKLPDLDIIHTHSPAPVGILGKHIAHQKNIPLLYTAHADLIGSARYYFLRESVILPKIAQYLTRWFAQQVDHIIAPSPKMEQAFRELGIVQPITVLPTGVDISTFKRTKESKRQGEKLRLRHGIAPDQKLLVYAGRLRKEKNLPFLIRAYREVVRERPKTTLMFIGEGPEKRSLETLCRRWAIPPPVFTGLVAHKDIPAYYASADLLVISSHTDTQALIVLEALASSLPVVALNDRAFEGILENNKNGFLVPGESETQFAQRCLELLNDENAYHRFALAARTTAEIFTAEAQTTKLLTLYEDLLAKPRLERTSFRS